MKRFILFFAALLCAGQSYFPPISNTGNSPGGGIVFPPNTGSVCCSFYVDPAGSNSNNGTSALTPWQTISKVNAATLTPGQSVGFKSGGIWRESLTPGQSGSAGNSILFTSYAGGAQPIISGSNLDVSWSEGTTTKQVFITSGTTTTVPSDWNSAANSISVIGGGGAGHDGNGSVHAGAGAGAGAFSQAVNVSLTPSGTISVAIGLGGITDGANGGDTYICNTNVTNCASIAGTAVVAGAHGGTGATNNSIGGLGGSIVGAKPATGGTLFAGGTGGNSLSEGGGGAGAGGPKGAGKAGGASATGTGAGGGGGGDGGGTDGSPSSGLGNGGTGGNNNAGVGHGTGGTGSGCTDGTVGGGAGGGDNTSAGCKGGAGIEFDGSRGSGGGGGGGGLASANGGNGGLYGGAGAGSGGSSSAFGTGANGVIVMAYTGLNPNVWTSSITTQPNIVYFDGTRGTLVNSIASITVEFNWFWASNILYVYSPTGSDPSLHYTNPGIEIGQRDRVITTGGNTYLTFNNLDVRDSNAVGDVMIAINGTTVRGIVFQNSTVERGSSIAFGVGFMATTPHDVMLNNNLIQNNGGSGVWMYSEFASGTITGNTVTGNGWASARDNQEYSGIEDFLGNLTISGNTVFANAPNCKNAGTVGSFCHGIYAGESTNGATITNNTVYSMANGSGIKAIGSALITGNLTYSNGLHGIQLGQNVATNVVYSIYYNVAYGNNQTNVTGIGGIGELSKGSGTINLTAANNTLYNNGNTNGYEIFIADNLTALTLKNNILFASSTRPTYGFTVPQTGAVIDYNLAWRADGNADIIYNGSGINWATWQGLGFDVHGLNSNPLFTNAGSAVFTLQSGSPAINAGVCIMGITLCPTNMGAK